MLAAAGSSISRQSAVVVDEEASVSDGAAWAGIIVGLLSIPVVAWSEYTLFSTGCGLPPGPSGLLGATEGVSYLVVAALALWSLSSKASTAKGLPPGI